METEIKAPVTELEKTACKKAKQEAIERAVEAKKKEYEKAMDRLIAKEQQIRDYKEILAKAQEEYDKIVKALNIAKTEEKQLF